MRVSQIAGKALLAVQLWCRCFGKTHDQTCTDEVQMMQHRQKKAQDISEKSQKSSENQLPRDLPGTLLNDVAFLETHDSGTGLGVSGNLVSDVVPNGFAQTQQGDLVAQVNCGARALDLRLAYEDGEIFFHHNFLKGTMNFQSSMSALVDWANQHPTELVILYVNHCQYWHAGTQSSESVTCGEDGPLGSAFIKAVTGLGINYAPGLMGPDCKNANGTQMLFETAKALAKLPGGGMLLPIFQNTASSDCVNENFNQASGNTWGTGAGLESDLDSCAYLGTSSSFFSQWIKLWTYAQSILGVDGQGKMHETQVLWQEDAASIVSAGLQFQTLLDLNEKSNINEAVYKQILQGFLPPSSLNMVKMNNICRWGPEISRLLGATVSDSDAQQCQLACSAQTEPSCSTDSSTDVCCSSTDTNCCGACRCTGQQQTCTISGFGPDSVGPCDGVCASCSNEQGTGSEYQTWGDDNGILTWCPYGYKCPKVPTGQPCGSNSDCANDACGYPFAGASSLVCCSSGQTGLYAAHDYCTEMSDGTACFSDAMCSGGICSGNDGGISKGTCSSKAAAGEPCGSNSDCANGACGRPEAGADSLVCCSSGQTDLYAFYDYCTGMSAGTACFSDAMCASGDCSGNGDGLWKGNCS